MTTDTPHIRHLIGGQMIADGDVREAQGPGRLDDVVARVAVGTADDVNRAVAAAHQAFVGWRDTPAAGRASKLLAAAETVGGAAGDLAPLLVRVHGGVLRDAQTSNRSISACRSAASSIPESAASSAKPGCPNTPKNTRSAA